MHGGREVVKECATQPANDQDLARGKNDGVVVPPRVSISQAARPVTRPISGPSSGKGKENTLSEANDSVPPTPVGLLKRENRNAGARRRREVYSDTPKRPLVVLPLVAVMRSRLASRLAEAAGVRPGTRAPRPARPSTSSG